MKLALTTAALALTLGLGGCMGAMHDEHHDAMMGEHGTQECPNAEQVAHDHSVEQTPRQCPHADAAQHQHEQPQN